MPHPATAGLEARSRTLGSAAIVVAAASFATLGSVSKLAYAEGLSPLGFVSWRSAIGGGVLALFLLVRIATGQAGWVALRSLPRPAQRNLAIALGAAVAINLGMFVAFERISVALALLGFYTYPVMVAIVDAFARGERPPRLTLVALGLAVGGMGLTIAGQLGGGGAVRLDLIGLALALGAAAGQTIYVSVARTGYSSVPTLQAMTTILLGSAVAFAAITILSGGIAQLGGPVVHPAAWGLMAIGGVVGGGLASLLFLVGVRWIGGLRAGILALLEPVIAVLLAVILIGEALGPLQIAGGALVLTAAVLLQAEGERPMPGRPVQPPPAAVPGTI